MELAQRLVVNNGIRVTFVNSESNHARVVEALPPDEKQHELLHLVSISDGLESWEDRLYIAKAMQALGRVVPAEVEALIESTNATQADAVTCVLTDFYMAGVTQAYEKFSLKTAAFMPGSAALLASTISADKLLEDGVVDTNGTPLHSGAIKLSPSMPEMNPNHLPWVCLPDLHQRSVFFRFLLDNNKSAKLAQFLVCNTAPELEAAALDFMPKCLPIGPLLASSRLGKQSGYFWPENPTCLSWLDQQTPNSVVYVAFGSFTVLDSVQFRELALGLELAGKPFLWVVRQDITADLDKAYPIGFKERVRNQGKMVNWAPQQQVLSHPSIACFVSHCGWNSTVESVSNGVPILCWPYFTDQFLNETYIVDHWGVGLRLEKDDSGTFRKEEVQKKLEVILSDEEEGCRRRVVKLREKTLASGNGGICNKNLGDFMDWINED